METFSLPNRIRWPVAVLIGGYSFFGKAPVEGLDWLFTDKGRLCLLLVALGIGFWPGIWNWIKEQFLACRPMSKRKLRKETQGLVADIYGFAKSHPSAHVTTANAFFGRSAQEQDATTPEEKREIGLAINSELTAAYENERHELHERFGGRIQHVVGEFRRRALLLDDEASILNGSAARCTGSRGLLRALRDLPGAFDRGLS
jgi:hypothetical protein